MPRPTAPARLMNVQEGPSRLGIGDIYWAIRHSGRFGGFGGVVGGLLGLLSDGCGGLLIGAMLGSLTVFFVALAYQWNVLKSARKRKDAIEAARLRFYEGKADTVIPPRALPMPPTPVATPKPPTIVLWVPYAEKDQAKRLGAHWDPTHRTWFIPSDLDPVPFSRWLPPPSAPDAPEREAGWLRLARHFGRLPQVLFLRNPCWRCRRQGYAVALAVHLRPDEERWVSASNAGHEAGVVTDGRCSWLWVEGSGVAEPWVLDQLAVHLAARPDVRGQVATFKKRHSKARGITYLSQGCPYCQALWGDHPLSERSLDYLEQVAGQRYDEGGLIHAFDLELDRPGPVAPTVPNPELQ